MSNRLLATTIGLAMALLSACAWGQDAPAVISAETKAVAGELNEAQKAEVDTFLKSCARRLTTGPTTASASSAQLDSLRKGMAAIRNDMAANYASDNGAGYKRYFAISADMNFAAVCLVSPDPLVQVNAALALARIRQPEIAPALCRMLASSNAAVRYQGIKAYIAIREGLLNQSAEVRERMMAGLLAVAENESGPVVLDALYEALDLSSIPNVSEQMLRQFRPRARLAATNSLRRSLPVIRHGDAAMAQAVARGARTLLGASAADMPKNERTELLQVLADLMKNAAVTHQELSKSLLPGIARDRQRDSIELMAQEYANAITELERVIGQIVGRADVPVAEALRQRPMSPEKVMLAVNDWVGSGGEGGSAGRLGAEGVHPPTVLSDGPVLPKPVAVRPGLGPIRTSTSAPATSTAPAE
jgi:hypothetical protein